MKTAKSAGAVADRATVIVNTVRPIVVKAMNDPELHEALRKAFSTGKDVKDEISGRSATQAAQKIAANRKLQKKVEESAQDLQKAVKGVVEPPKKKGRIKRTIGRIAIIGAVAGAVMVVLRKVRGRGDDPSAY